MFLACNRLGRHLRFSSVLPARLSELAIIITARRWTQDYEWYAHSRIGAHAGLEPDTIRAVAEGRRPDNLIPVGDPDLLFGEINEKYSVDSLAIVGHEPYLTTLISLLVGKGTPLDMELKKGGVCRLSTDDLHHSRHATLEWLLTPGVLVEISEK